MGELTLTINKRDFTIDWDKDRDPTEQEIASISRTIYAAEFGAKPSRTVPQQSDAQYRAEQARLRARDIKLGGGLNDDERRYDELGARRKQIETQLQTGNFHREQVEGLRKELSNIYAEQKKLKADAPVKTEQKVQQIKQQNKQSQIDKLPFTEQEIRRAVDLGLSQIRTKAGGIMGIRQAIARWERATGEIGVSGTDPYALDKPELYAFELAGKQNPETVMKTQGGRPYVPSIVENPEKNAPILTDVPGKILRGVVQSNLDKYPNLSKQEKDDILQGELNTDLVKGSNEVFNLSKYFVPGLQTLAGFEDVGLLKARADEVGLGQAGKEAIQGFIQGANVFEPGLSPVQRVGRGINAVLLGLGLTHGAVKGYQGGKKALAQSEIARKFGLSKEAAGQWLQKMEGTVVEHIQTAELRGNAFNDGKVIEAQKSRQAAQTSKNTTNRVGEVVDDIGGTDTGVAARVGGTLADAPDVSAMPGTTNPGQRILPAPIVTGKAPKSPAQILKDAQRALHRVVFKGTPDARGALGTYNASNTRTVIRFADDLDTAAHEISHALDDQFQILTSYRQPRAKSPFDAELQPFWVHTSRSRYTLNQKRAEGVAEWVRAYIVNPDEAIRLAPEFYKHFKNKVDANVIKALDDFGKDIREYAGATNTEKVKANIVFDNPRIGGLGKIWTDSKRVGIRQAIQDSLLNSNSLATGYSTPIVSSKLKRFWTDDIDPVVKGIQETMRRRGINNLLPENDPILLARGLAYFKNKYDSILEHGMVNARNERIGKPVEHILEPLDATSKETLTQDLNDMLALIVSERTLEKTAQLGKERVTNFGAGFYKSSDIAVGAIDELAKNPERFARLQESAARYREWADQILTYAVEKGRLSKKDYDTIKANNQYYAAMNRLMDSGVGGATKLSTGSFGRSVDNAIGRSATIIKKFKGSTRPIENPLVSLMEQGYQIIKDADRNEVLLKWREMLTQKRRMGDGLQVDLASIGHRVPNSQKGPSVTIWVNGKREKWVFEDGIMDSLKDLGTTIEIGDLPMKVLSFFPKLMRESVTHTPGFAFRNRIRDIQDRLIKSRTGSNIGGDTFKRVTQKELENYSLYGGGVGSGRVLDDSFNFYAVQKHLMNQMAKDKNSVLMLPGKAWDWYKKQIEAGERAGRIGEVRSALRKAKEMGFDEYNAQLYAHGQSRDLLDFARGGKFAKVINRFIPFTNAQIQGISRTMTGAHQDPGKFAANWLKYAVTPTMVNYAWNRSQGEETFQEYLQLPPYLRRTFYNFKVGDMWIRIPKPYELGATASLLEHTIDAALRGTWSEGQQVEENLGTLQFFSPFNADQLTGGAIAPFVESITNYDSFKNKAIVPYWENSLNLVEREGTDNASRLGQALQKVFKVDARMIDHHIESQFADFGRMAQAVSDIGRTDRVLQSNAKALNLVTGVFVDSPGMNAVDVQWVLKEAQGIGIQRRALAISDELTAYNDAKSPEAKRAAAKKLWLKANQIRAKAERRMNGISKESKDYKKRLAPLLTGG